MRIYCLLLCLTFYCFSSNGQQTFLFIGSYNMDKTLPGIYVYSFNNTTGSLSKITDYSGVLNPSFLVASNDGKYLYACTESRAEEKGSVSSFKFDKQLTLISQQPTGAANPVYVALNKTERWLLSGSYTGGGVTAFPLNSNGEIGKAAQNFLFQDSSIRPQQKSAHIHSVNFSPNGQVVYLPDLGADKIRTFHFNPSNKVPLSQESFIKTVPGSGPRHMAFHSTGKFAYCLSELSGAVTVYSVNKDRLDSIQEINLHTKSHQFYSSADIHLSPDGQFLYASNRGEENNLAIFRVNNKSGKLTLVGYQSTLGDHPRNFVIDPSGKFLLVANEYSGNIIVFRRNTKTGLLTMTSSEITIKGPSCLIMKSYSMTP
jgi:6-phosphogluconolactonase